MDKLTLLVVFLAVPLIALAAEVTIDGFCDNYRTVNLINFPYDAVNGLYFYMTDNYNSYGSYLYSPNKTVVAPFNSDTIYFKDVNGNDIAPSVSVPDCGTDYGNMNVDMSNYCNYNNYAIEVDSTILETLGSDYSYYYIALYFTPNNYQFFGNWDYLYYQYNDNAQVNIYSYSSYMAFKLFVYNPQYGYSIPLASKVITGVSNCSSSVFTVDVSDYCNDLRRVRVLMNAYQYATYFTPDMPQSVWGIYNNDNTTKWVEVETYGNSGSVWNFTAYSRFGIADSYAVTFPYCSGEYGPLYFDNTGYCGNGFLLSIHNPLDPNQNYNWYDYYVYVRRIGDPMNYQQNSFYVPPNTTQTYRQYPGEYIIYTQSYAFVSNGSQIQVESSHRILNLTCPPQYGTDLVVDTTNYCTNGYYTVTGKTNNTVQIYLSYPGAIEFGPNTYYTYGNTNYYGPDAVWQVYTTTPGYYTAHRYDTWGDGYPHARYDFVLPVCTPQTSSAVTIDLTNYCSNFRNFLLSNPPDTVTFLYLTSDLTKVLAIYASTGYYTNTYNVAAPVPGYYSFISYLGNIPNPNNIIARSDVNIYDCGENFGPAVPVIDSTGYCDNFKRVTITLPGYSNFQFQVYTHDNVSSLGYTNNYYDGQYNRWQIALPNPGQYMLVYGDVKNPMMRYFFTLTDSCPTQFGNFTIDNNGYCNNHKRWSILVPYQMWFWFYSNYDPANPYNYYSYAYNYDTVVPAYKSFQLGNLAVNNFTVVTYNSNSPGDTSATGFITSRTDFALANPPQCPDFFGPEYIVQSCDFTGGVVTIQGVVANSQYYLIPVNTPYDDITNSPSVGTYYINQETQLKISLPYNSLYVLVSKYNNDITSKLFIDGSSSNTNVTSAQFYFPPTVNQGDVAYAEVSLAGIPAFCLTANTLCKFGSIVIAATNNNGMLRCQVPLMPVGTYSVSFSTDNGVSFSTSCRTIQVIQDTQIAFDYREYTFDTPTEAFMVWDRASTAGQGWNYVLIEAYKYSMLNVSGESQIMVLQKMDTLFNRSINVGYYKWDTQYYDLSFMALQISFGNSYSHYVKRSVAYVQCKWSYCGRRSFCSLYGYNQPTDMTVAAANPFDQACKSHAICSTTTTLCPSFCDEILLSMLTSTLYGTEQPNPFSLGAPASSSFTNDDVLWAQKAVFALSKSVAVSLREVPTVAPNPCPAVPTLTQTITTMGCGDPHFTIGNNLIYDMQLPGEFIYFSGHLKKGPSSLIYGATDFNVASSPTVIMTQQKPIVTTPHYISILTGVAFTTRQAPHSSIVVSSLNGLQLYHDGVLINLLQSCNYYFVGGSASFTSTSEITVILDDGIQVTISGGYGSICLTMTISGVFMNTGGFFGGVTAVGNVLHGKCNNGSTFTVGQGVLGNENLALGRCWQLTGSSNVFQRYNLTFPLHKKDLSEIRTPKRNFGLRDDDCDSIPNPMLAEMCNADLPYMPDVPASAIAAVSSATANTFNLATGVTLLVSLDQVVQDVVMTLNVSLENWNLISNPLTLEIQTRYASSADLASFTNWEDYFVDPQDYNVDPIVTSIVFTPASACTTYSVRVQVTSVNTNYSSPWISASFASEGSCFSAIIESNAVIVSNDLPSPDNFTEIAAVDPPAVTTDAITVGFEFTTSPVTTQPLTTHVVTTRQLTTKPLSTGVDLTSQPITSQAVTSGVDFTTQSLTTKAVTSGVDVTTKPLTTKAITSGVDITTQMMSTKAVTSAALTTDFSSVASRCGSYSFSTIQAYFCSADQKGYYQCLKGAYAPQSAYRSCAPGTFCRCAPGVECTPYGVCTF